MKKKIKARVMDARNIKRTLQRMSTEIIERNRNLKNLVIIGIRTRGIYLGKRISKLIKTIRARFSDGNKHYWTRTFSQQSVIRIVHQSPVQRAMLMTS